MPQPKFKTESYQNFGGINQKVSPHATGIFEFLDLRDLDFQTPGSLSQRWGSTQYIGQTYPGQINSLFEFARLDGSSYVVQSFSGGIFYGATTGNCQGISFTLQSATFQSFYYPVEIRSVSLAIVETTPSQFPFQGDVSALTDSDWRDTPSYFNINPAVQSANRLSYAILNNYLLAGDGNKFFKFDGVTTTSVGLPYVMRPYGSSQIFSVNPDIGVSLYLTNLSGASDLIALPIGNSGGFFYGVYFSYLNNRGFEGPMTPFFRINANIAGATAAAQGGSFLALRVAVTTPSVLGISAIKQYIYSAGTTFPQQSTFSDDQFWGGYGGQMRLVSQTPASGSTITWIACGSTIGGASAILSNSGGLSPTNGYQPLGLTTVIGQIPIGVGSSQLGPNVIQEYDLAGYYPQFLETYQNRLFLAGFSTTPSTVWFSDVAEPEGYNPDFNFEVRTNDGDSITCIKAYSTEFYIFKQRSFHVLTGDSPTNFDLRQITDQYGCLNNRCCVLFVDQMMFLDAKGLVLWNGAGINPISDAKIKPIFERMNVQAAMTEACMVHDKIRNQILVSVPVDGSSTNNMVIVYNYLLGAFTRYALNVSSFAQIKGRTSDRNTFFGDYAGRVNYFGASFATDNGATILPYWKTRFLRDMGDSVTKTYRRLYIDTDAPGASINAFRIDFYQNYGPSIILSTTLTLSQTQRRIDFGLQNSKSVAFELTGLQMALPLRIHGFTLEYALRRRV